MKRLAAFCISCGVAIQSGAQTGTEAMSASADVQALLDGYQAQELEWLPLYLADPPPAASDFNFLLGEWNTQQTFLAVDGSVQATLFGTWRAQSIDNGRMIMDEYIRILPGGVKIHAGYTLRTYSPSTQRWEMTHLQPLKPVAALGFHGRRQGDEIHLEARSTDSDGHLILTKIRFFQIGENSFDWAQRNSFDGGETWHRTMLIKAQRITGDL